VLAVLTCTGAALAVPVPVAAGAAVVGLAFASRRP
jgi:hypothetical protein